MRRTQPTSIEYAPPPAPRCRARAWSSRHPGPPRGTGCAGRREHAGRAAERQRGLLLASTTSGSTPSTARRRRSPRGSSRPRDDVATNSIASTPRSSHTSSIGAPRRASARGPRERSGRCGRRPGRAGRPPCAGPGRRASRRLGRRRPPGAGWSWSWQSMAATRVTGTSSHPARATRRRTRRTCGRGRDAGSGQQVQRSGRHCRGIRARTRRRSVDFLDRRSRVPASMRRHFTRVGMPPAEIPAISSTPCSPRSARPCAAVRGREPSSSVSRAAGPS